VVFATAASAVAVGILPTVGAGGVAGEQPASKLVVRMIVIRTVLDFIFPLIEKEYYSEFIQYVHIKTGLSRFAFAANMIYMDTMLGTSGCAFISRNYEDCVNHAP
jgi:hypothetical protein